MPALGSLCLQSLAQHMQSVWAKDYSENYLDEYQFRFVMGPFNDLGEWRAPGPPARGGGGWGSGAGAAPLTPGPPPQPAAWCRS